MSRTLRGILLVVALVVAVIVLFTTVFPWVEANLITDPTLGLYSPSSTLGRGLGHPR